MLTLKTIDRRLQEFATAHAQLRVYSRGKMADFNQGKADEYPRLHMVYEGASYDGATKAMSFALFFLSLPTNDQDAEKQNDIVSDMERVAEDLLSDLYLHQNQAQEDTQQTRAGMVAGGTDFGMAYQNASITPVVEERNNVLCGVRMDVQVLVGFRKER